MTTRRSRPLSYPAFAVLLLLASGCGVVASPSPAPEPAVTATEQGTSTGTSTITATLGPADIALTEYARQAEGTRQVLVETEVALKQSIDATATARSLDQTATALAPLPPVSQEVEVQANVMWQDTGIQVRYGDTVKFQYISGQWTIWIDADPLTDGMGQYGREETCRLMPEANLGGLVGRVGDGPPFFIGNEIEIYSVQNGTLQLSINDCPQFDNNAGSLTVSVVIDR